MYGTLPYADVKEQFDASGFDRYIQLPITPKVLFNLLKLCSLKNENEK